MNSQNCASQNCAHEETVEEHGIMICMLCGTELDMPSMTTYETGRCQFRVGRDRSLYDDIQGLPVPPDIAKIANDVFLETCKPPEVSDGRTHRRACRKSIVFACIFYAYKLRNEPRTCDTLAREFNVPKKCILRGIKYVNEHGPKIVNTNKYITPEHLIREYLATFDPTVDWVDGAVAIYLQVEDRSKTMLTSRPQSIAAGIIYYYTCTHCVQFDTKAFLEHVKISETTVAKIGNECKRILRILHGRT